MIDYRSRIYVNYASRFQDAGAVFDAAAAERWGRAYDYYFRGWLPNRRDARIVDLACGGGRLLHFFKRRGYQDVEGVDISPEQVRLARQVVPGVEHADVIDFLEAHPASFDLITGLDIIEHFRKDEVLRFLDGCFGALRSHGRLILQTPNAESPWGSDHRYNDFTHEVAFNPNAACRILSLCGFIAVEAREQGPVPSGYSLKSSLRSLAWQAIRAGLVLWNVIETGWPGSRVFTRIFIVSGRKP